MNISPRTQATLFRIWQYAEPIGWDCTPSELAEKLDTSVQHIGSVLKCKPEWINRLRVGQRRINEDARLDGRNEHLELI